MTENIEAAELRAQLDECQRIIAAQAETIAAANTDAANHKTHNEMMVLRAKKAEEELAGIKAIDLDRQGRGEPVAFRAEALELSGILAGMVECGDPDPNTLYTEDQPDGDHFVSRAATLLRLLVEPQPAEPAVKDSLTAAEPVKEGVLLKEFITAAERDGVERLGLAHIYADPEKEPSDEQILELWGDDYRPDDAVIFARALLASYGKAAQPSVPEPTPEMLDRAVAFALNVKISAEYGWTQYMRDLWAHMTAAAPAYGQAQQDADKPTCVAPMSDKPTCGAQNAECETQRPDPAMAGGDWLTEITAKVSTLIGCCIRIPKGGAKAHDDAVVTHGEVLALLHKRVQPASGEDARDALIAAIQKKVEILPTMPSGTKIQIEYWKAGARASIHAVNAAIYAAKQEKP